MDLALASAPAIADACTGLQCDVDRGFEHQVNRLGERLAESAYAAHPDLKDRIPAFKFSVADKRQAGIASDAGGNIVVYRAVHTPGLDETVLTFLIAREMGHAIARHHDEKSAASLVASLVVHLLLPATNLVGGAALFASTAASAVGANAMVDDDDPNKTQEATSIAMDLMTRQGWSPGEVRNALAAYSATLSDDSWGRSVKVSLAAVEQTTLDHKLLALHP